MKIHAIAAMSLSRVIGNNDTLPWYYPEDLKFFKSVTQGHAVLMGRKTFESIGRPLPNRKNYVLTRQNISIPGIITVRDISEINEEEIFLIGGAELYRQYLPVCDTLYLTHILHEYEGDAYFPSFRGVFTNDELLVKNDDFKIYKFYK